MSLASQKKNLLRDICMDTKQSSRYTVKLKTQGIKLFAQYATNYFKINGDRTKFYTDIYDLCPTFV